MLKMKVQSFDTKRKLVEHIKKSLLGGGVKLRSPAAMFQA
jgi:hypothetical protein